MRRLLTTSLALALGLALANPAAAQEEDARHHFRIGQAHYDSGHFVEAAQEFEAAFRLSNRPALLHNIYVAYRDAGDLERSADALRRYLAAVPDAPNGTVLTQRLASLDRLIAERGGGAGASSSEVPEQASTETSGETTEETEATPATTDGAAASTASAAAPTTGGGGEGGLSPVGFIVGGLGAAMLITGAVTGALALSSESSLVETCGEDGACPAGFDHESEVATGQALAITTDIMIPVGVAALAAGVVLILVLRDGGGDDVAAGAACGPDGCMGTVAGAF